MPGREMTTEEYLVLANAALDIATRLGLALANRADFSEAAKAELSARIDRTAQAVEGLEIRDV